jgi:hypothetical protein
VVQSLSHLAELMPLGLDLERLVHSREPTSPTSRRPAACVREDRSATMQPPCREVSGQRSASSREELGRWHIFTDCIAFTSTDRLDVLAL